MKRKNCKGNSKICYFYDTFCCHVDKLYVFFSTFGKRVTRICSLIGFFIKVGQYQKAPSKTMNVHTPTGMCQTLVPAQKACGRSRAGSFISNSLTVLIIWCSYRPSQLVMQTCMKEISHLIKA